jgi:DnaJ-class molecular chaperone
VKVPKGTQIGDRIKVGGKGFGTKGLFASKWDLLIETQVSIPKKLSKDEEKLRKELKNLEV